VIQVAEFVEKAMRRPIFRLGTRQLLWLASFSIFSRDQEYARLLFDYESLVVDLVVEKVVEFVVENHPFSRHFFTGAVEASKNKKPRKHWYFRGFYCKRLVGGEGLEPPTFWV